MKSILTAATLAFAALIVVAPAPHAQSAAQSATSAKAPALSSAKTAAPTTNAASAPTTPAGPLIADVHASPYRGLAYDRPNLRNQRFDLRDATLLDIIALAYDRDNTTILGGPTWLELDRYDITTMVPSLKTSSPNPANPAAISQSNPFDPVRPILQRILAERFQLTFHTQDKPLPGYVMTVAKSGLKMTEAKDPDAPPSCHGEQDKDHPGQTVLACTSETVTLFLKTFGGIYPHRVVDNTGLTKAYDFSLAMSFQNIRTRDQLVHIYTDALASVGLIVTPADVPQPAMVIDAADRIPTPNQPDLVKQIPPMPPLEFEVATIKPAADNELQGIMPRGSQLTFSAQLLQELIVRAWQLATGATLGPAVDALPKQRYTVLVKLPPEIDARMVWEDQDEVDSMLQKLLIDRFGIKYHWTDQTRPGYVLLPGSGPPKMKPADPNSRSFCKTGPPPGEKDMTSAPDSPYDHEFYCQNVTMDQFAELLQGVGWVEIKNRVPNRTGLAGAWDFTVYFTSGHKLRIDTAAAEAAAKQSGDSMAAPVNGLSMADAFRKELGLRLEQQPITLPTLVLDHLNPTPTAN